MSNNNINHNKINTNPTIKNNKKNIITNPQPRNHASTTQACAACKYQRRKCTPDCILAPYFPYDRQRQFLNAHRLFGVSNIVKIIKNLTPQAKDEAMRTIIFQSNARAADPVGGCYHIIRDLEHHIGLARAELDYVLHHLALYRAASTIHQQQVVHVGPTPDVREEMVYNWCTLEQYYDNEKWKVENEVLRVDDVNSWACMNDDNLNVNANGDFNTSSFLDDNNVKMKRTIDECINGDMNPNFDPLSCGVDNVRVGVQV